MMVTYELIKNEKDMLVYISSQFPTHEFFSECSFTLDFIETSNISTFILYLKENRKTLRIKF